MKSNSLPSLAGIVCFAALTSLSQAAPLTTWTQFAGGTASGLNTSSPVLGDGTLDSGDNFSIYAASPTYTLSSVGSKLTLTGGVTFANLVTPQADQFKFGIYDVNGQTGATGWLGYMASNSGSSGGPTGSRLWERNNPNTGSFGSGTGATSVATVNATPSNTAFASGTYNFTLTYTQVATGLHVDWTLTGVDVTYSVSGSYLDTTPQTYTFNRVGIFTGGGLNANQVSLSNLDLTYTAAAIPEPATASLLLGAVGLLAVARHRRAASAA